MATIVPTGYTEVLAYSGTRNVGTLGGQITLEQNTGRLVVRDGTGQERTLVDIKGLTTIRANGQYANRVGQATSDNRDGMWSAKPGIDLRDQGI